jgi:hypothetical protein
MSLGRGRPLSLGNVTALAQAAGHHRGAITAVLTAADVPVASFCVSRCGVHDHDRGGAHGRARYTYLWAGESPSLVLVINDTKLLMLLYQV